MKNKILKQLVTVLMSLLIVFIAIPMEIFATQKISGDYVLIVNESLTEAQQIGTISFDNTNPFGSSNGMQSLSVNEDLNQPKQTATSSVFGIENLSFNPQAVTKTYTLGETKDMVFPTNRFTVRGIGANCVIWMDAAADLKYTSQTLPTAITSIINTYENHSYPALKTLGADTKMNYADGSGKLSIFIRGAATNHIFPIMI